MTSPGCAKSRALWSMRLESDAPPISLKEAERLAIENALRYNGGRRRQTAETLGLSEKGLFNKIKEYHIDVP